VQEEERVRFEVDLLKTYDLAMETRPSLSNNSEL
jgi:hypothetical protein